MSSPMDKNELPPGSRLSRLKAQFQQKQMQEKEHKLLQMLDNQQQRAMQKATINGVLPSKYSNNGYSSTLSTPSSNSAYTNYSTGPGKVRQMFEERRKGGGSVLPSNNSYNGNSNGNNTNGSQGYRNGGFVGIDKSYPLDPLVAPTSNSKNRTASSKSDPNPTNNNLYSRNGRSNLTASKTPSNIGAQKRGLSLERSGGGGSERTTPASRSRDRDLTTSFTSNGTAVIGTGLRRASSGLTNFDSHEVNSNSPSNLSRPTMPNNNLSTTKYSDMYGGGPKDLNDTIAKRESNLAMKMKNMNIYDSKPSSTESKASNRSASPVKRNVAPPPTRVMPSSPIVKPSATKKTAINKPPVRSGPPPPGTEQCKICGRYFASDRLEKHQTICKKTSTKKRKVFDPTKMRMQGTEAEPYIRRVSAKVSNKAAPKGDGSLKKSDWRKKHEEFIKTIRAAKIYQAHVDAGGNPADLPPPPPADTSDYVQCPYCNRKFSEGAAERHIPKCKNIKSNKRR